jgi:drug/metabolite transporter (DMT)-like permease
VNAPRQRPLLGVALVICAGACFSLLDNCAKLLGATLPVLLFMWARYAFQALAMLVWLGGQRGGAGFKAAHPKFQLLRGSLLLGTSALSFYGVQLMPVAEFTAIGMLTPVVVTMLAAFWLRESVSLRRWALVVGAFVGALIVIRPGSGVFGWAAAMPLLMALCYGCFQVLTSRLASLENPFTTHFYTGLVGAAALTPVLWLMHVPVWQLLRDASAQQWLLILVIGAMGTVGHLLLILALGMARTGSLMPFVYVQILFAALVGWLMFGHLPDRWAWAGMLVIAACGASSVWLNFREASAKRLHSAVEQDTIAD